MAVERTERGGGVGQLSPWLLDAVVALLSTLLIVGVALDFRRHAGGISFAEEGFFTPEHVFFYSMFLAIAGVIGAVTVARRRAGASWLTAMPKGYRWGVVGVVIFGLGGLGDLAWHGTFGFEEGVEALTSPSHLALAIGAGLFLASPLRAAMHRDVDYSGLRSAPVVVSTSLVLAVVALIGAYLNPLMRLWHLSVGDPVVDRLRLSLAIASLATFPLLLVGGALVLRRQFDVPPGALTVTFLGPAFASTIVHGQFAFVLPALLAGIVGDLLVVSGSREGTRGFRAFCVLVPAAFVVGYNAVAHLTAGLWWPVEVWTGTVLIAGLAGLLLSYVAGPAGAWSS